ncbi:MAG: DUF6265 family protein [Ferruginibacter sp.]
MKNALEAIIVMIICGGFVNYQKNSDPVFNQLYALEGKWIMKTKKGFIGEEWKKINKDYLQNSGYMIRGNDTIITERVALRNKEEGIFYISTAEGQNSQQPVEFKLTSADNNSFVFENPQHDFPKRITYSFINKDSLHAWIDDGKKIIQKKESFHYSRQK